MITTKIVTISFLAHSHLKPVKKSKELHETVCKDMQDSNRHFVAPNILQPPMLESIENRLFVIVISLSATVFLDGGDAAFCNINLSFHAQYCN